MKPLREDHVKIVLPCTNEGPWLRVTVDAILDVTDYSSFEIFVLANGDDVTDFTFVEQPRYRDRVTVVERPEPLGVGNCINQAVAPGDAMYYVFLDAHCLVREPSWLVSGGRAADAGRDAVPRRLPRTGGPLWTEGRFSLQRRFIWTVPGLSRLPPGSWSIAEFLRVACQNATVE